MFTFSGKLEKWSFHVADLPRTGEKCTEIKKHVKGVQSFCFCSFNMQNLWRCRCRRVEDLKLPNVGGSVISSRRQQQQHTLLQRFTLRLLAFFSVPRDFLLFQRFSPLFTNQLFQVQITCGNGWWQGHFVDVYRRRLNPADLCSLFSLFSLCIPSDVA